MSAGLRKHSVTALVVCLAVSHLAGLIGWTVAGPGEWYRALVKPSYNPPGWVFAPVWSLMYTLMGCSLYLVWTSPVSRRASGWPGNPYVAFGYQWVLNAVWTPVFFGWHSIAGGLTVLGLLLGAIGWTLTVFARVDRLSAWLLAPYALWGVFAFYLNATLLLLNPSA